MSSLFMHKNVKIKILTVRIQKNIFIDIEKRYKRHILDT